MSLAQSVIGTLAVTLPGSGLVRLCPLWIIAP